MGEPRMMTRTQALAILANPSAYPVMVLQQAIATLSGWGFKR